LKHRRRRRSLARPTRRSHQGGVCGAASALSRGPAQGRVRPWLHRTQRSPAPRGLRVSRNAVVALPAQRPISTYIGWPFSVLRRETLGRTKMQAHRPLNGTGSHSAGTGQRTVLGPDVGILNGKGQTLSRDATNQRKSHLKRIRLNWLQWIFFTVFVSTDANAISKGPAVTQRQPRLLAAGYAGLADRLHRIIWRSMF